jgi:hypothetical protein
MRDVLILTLAGSVVGLAIGLWLPVPRELGWLRSTLGGAAAFGGFGLGGNLLSRIGGRPLGWAIGGVIGSAVGGAAWIAAIGHVSRCNQLPFIGATVGIVGGAICGPFLGAVAACREIKDGQSSDSVISLVAMSLFSFFIILLLIAISWVEPLE